MKGDERNWWSEETLEAFERKTECLKEQYSNFTFDGGTVRILYIASRDRRHFSSIRIFGSVVTKRQIT